MSISDEALDQLVAGSLSRVDYRRLLAALESDPAPLRGTARWLSCAEQALETDFKSLASADIDWDALQPYREPTQSPMATFD